LAASGSGEVGGGGRCCCNWRGSRRQAQAIKNPMDGFGRIDRCKDAHGRTANIDEIVQALWGFAGECSEEGHFGAASGYCKKILALVDLPGA
ncbi:MAG: hypothetical protein LAP85_26610, partial [Acidobacteriia bacterium]|nr:hypothetical protein [Terriglobia bacterium]